jgi:hypothetical protein
MKKLIAISVVFALVAGAAFAMDVTGTVFGHANLIEGSTVKDSKVTASGGMDRIRLDGAGEAGDGEFGGYIRAQVSGDFMGEWGKIDGFAPNAAYAWWKPIDQFKLIIGCNSDAFWGKEGVTGWMFNQMAYDCSIAINPGVWYGWGTKDDGVTADGSTPFVGGAFMHNRYVFYEGWADWGAGVEITPTDMVGINIAIPWKSGLNEDNMDPDNLPANQAAYIFRAAQFQLDLKLDFGNIALSYDGGYRNTTIVGSAGAIYLYAGLNVIENLGIDVGFSYHLTGDEKMGQTKYGLPIGVGVGLKYAADSFGVKFRTTAALAGDKEGPGGDLMYINSTVLPYFTISDNMAAFVNIGLGMLMGDGDKVKAMTGNSSNMGWFFNPYLRVGAEWGPTFYVGVKAESDGTKGYPDKTAVFWSVPIALQVSF